MSSLLSRIVVFVIVVIINITLIELVEHSRTGKIENLTIRSVGGNVSAQKELIRMRQSPIMKIVSVGATATSLIVFCFCFSEYLTSPRKDIDL